MMMLLAQPRASISNGAITSVLARARASEVLAESLGRGEARLAFTGGMISSFEELTQVPRAELEQTLALADDLRDAAFGADTALGRIVSDVADRQDGRAHARLLSGRSTPEIDAALAAGYEWAVRASSVLA
jgi:c-di-GMP-related signal transduction protein